MKAKILNVTDIYLLSNPLFLEAGQNDKFHLRLWAKFVEGKNDFRKLAALLLFLHRLAGLLVKSVDCSVDLDWDCKREAY